MKNYKKNRMLGIQIFFMAFSFFSIFSKMAAQEEFLSPKFILYYSVVIGNLGLYAIFWQQIIKRMSLVTAYANKAVTVVWGIVWGKIFYQESITLKKIAGGLLVVFGIILVVTDKEKHDA